MAQALHKWPDWMPLPQISDYNYEPVDRRSKTDMEVGSVIRVNFDTDETTVNCSLTLNQVQAAYFEAFERDVLKQGSKWFIMPLESGDRIMPHKVRFKQRPKASKKAPFHNSYSFVLEMEKRPDAICPALFRYVSCASPQSMGASADALNLALERIIPEIALPAAWCPALTRYLRCEGVEKLARASEILKTPVERDISAIILPEFWRKREVEQ